MLFETLPIVLEVQAPARLRTSRTPSNQAMSFRYDGGSFELEESSNSGSRRIQSFRNRCVYCGSYGRREGGAKIGG